MKSLKKTLNEPIQKTPFKFWHVLAGLSLLWVVPLLLPFDVLFNGYTIWIFIIAWAIAFRFVNYLMKIVLRTSTVDTILIERIFIFLSFLVPSLQSLQYVLTHEYSTFTLVINLLTWSISLLLFVGIIIHIKKAGRYYHGVKKDELFE